jgi:hypothetical protein
VKYSSVVSIQIFSLKNANPSINKIHDYFPLPSKFKMHSTELIVHAHTVTILYTIALFGTTRSIVSTFYGKAIVFLL